MKYLLNSAVITSEGQYDYKKISIASAKSWLSNGGWKSTIGYQQTSEALQQLTGFSIPVNRATIAMQPGDEALVFRLVFPSGYRPNPAQKGKMSPEFLAKNCEIGLLKRIK